MGKKSLAALVLAGCMALCSFSLTGCNIIDSSRPHGGGGQGSGLPDETEKEVTEVLMSESALTVTLGESSTVTLTATCKPDDATDKTVVWSCSNGDVAEVNGGVVTILAAGTAVITATASNGVSATCTLTVKQKQTPTEPDKPTDKEVTEVLMSENALTVTLGESSTVTLTATCKPTDATDKTVVWSSSNTNVAKVNDGGVVTILAAGTAVITATASNGVSATCTLTVKQKQTPTEPDNPAESLITYTYAGNECAAFEWTDANPANAKVEYKLSSETTYKQLDKQLIRTVGDKARADVLGLKGDATYDFKITSSTGKSQTLSAQRITAYDRSGYAHFKYENKGVGAYNDDGTLKNGAVIVYVNESTKNTVTAKFGSKTYTGIVDILKNLSKSSVPVVVRIVGTVGAATWNKIDYNADKKYNSENKLPSSAVKGINGKQLPTNSNTKQSDLIAGGYNTLNESVYKELKNLDSRAKYSSGEYDTIWNNCPISGAKNVTLEGVGEDARIFQWGLTWSGCNSIEVRNLTFEDYTEDACSFEGGGSSSTIDGFTSKNLWLHHNTFEEGINYWDLTAEQDKHEGDGATDFKNLSYLTCSYNQYHNNHKTGLVGGGDTVKTAAITYHHNYYNQCSSRLPLARQANMHMYNNYYYRSSGTNMSLRANAYAFIENCYFDNANVPIESKLGSEGRGYAKIFGCIFYGKQIASEYSSYLVQVTDRTAKVTNTNKYSQNFDTDPNVFYYDSANKRSNVSDMLTAEQVKTQVPLLAGVQHRAK